MSNSDKNKTNKMSEIRCKFHNTGYCKYEVRCKFAHPKDTCDATCNGVECPKRHPRPCKFGSKCKRKEICSYKHKGAANDKNFKDSIDALKEEFVMLKNENKANCEKIKSLENELKAMHTTIDKLEKKNYEIEAIKTKVEKLVTHNRLRF